MLKMQPKKKKHQEQAGSDDNCCKDLAEHHQGETQGLVISVGSRLQADIGCKGFATNIKN